jgi:hypothetical protein
MNLVKHNVAASPVSPTTLPPWQATSERERQQMVEWVIEQLDAQDAEYDMLQYELDKERDYYAPLPSVPAAEQRRLRLNKAIQRARNDNVELLRRLYPEIAEFIQPLKRPRGRRRSYPKKVWGRYAAGMIVDDVKRVRELWRANYGKWKRHTLRPTAEQIVAVRRGWTEGKVLAAIKLVSR